MILRRVMDLKPGDMVRLFAGPFSLWTVSEVRHSADNPTRRVLVLDRPAGEPMEVEVCPHDRVKVE